MFCCLQELSPTLRGGFNRSEGVVDPDEGEGPAHVGPTLSPEGARGRACGRQEGSIYRSPYAGVCKYARLRLASPAYALGREAGSRDWRYARGREAEGSVWCGVVVERKRS